MPNNSTEKEWDVVVIGGGAAGFFSAISVAEHSPRPLKIAILERSSQVLGKVKISGGGRCNVTHDCLDPKKLTAHYPRGQKSLIGPFHHFGTTDTINWFNERGVELKTEPDGRIFPITDSSQTIINCLTSSADELGIKVLMKAGVKSIQTASKGFQLSLDNEQELLARNVILATGGTRLAAGAKLAEGLGNELLPPVPSLFTFTIDHPLLKNLEGLSVKEAHVKIIGSKHENTGPLLITHWGVSGPGVLKLSALAARELAECDYTFTLCINWCPNLDLSNILDLKRQEWGKRQIMTRSPIAAMPKRLWERVCELVGIPAEKTWSQLSKKEEASLHQIIHNAELPVTGKSLNKDEFVTCGGVKLKDVNMKTLESKHCPNLYFAGEVLDIDGVTGGFNFQNAWTTGFLAGRAIAEKA